MNQKLKSALTKIIDTEIVVSQKKDAYKSIHMIENVYGVDLPSDYKEFLLEYGGSFIKDNIMYKPIEITPVTHKDGFDSIGGFYGITDDNYNIESVIKTYKDVLGKVLMPIADAGGGDLLCIGIKGQYKGKIYYWHHEGEASKDGKEYVYLIANSFEEFILKFTPHQREQNVNLDDIELFLDEDLLKD
ncbi:SMI1/KNR4 family protein [Bacillus sp. 7894-2]|uniref:SMI1/KNR4 family protein n=1 Tax=Bacillus sp. 7894-2 TaxID=2021695 RepID=UPI000BA7A1E0|nr:SMI1/KNR4 family protein [Bacillus sp. 7894-2]PAE23434.1 SMI1/KNR4 family protein [Bacillus sp. 7894-2]